MLRYCFALLASLCLASPASAATWADAMFRELSKDFGSVARGPMLEHPFRLTNNTGQPVHIASVRVSCGCVSAAPLQDQLAPGQETAILAHMDTRRFSDVKTVTIFVQIDQPHFEEVRLWVRANSRDDVSVTPEALAFGQIKRGSTPAQTVTVTFLGSERWQVLGAQCDSHYVQTAIKEIRRDDDDVSYQLTARLRPDSPVGKWYTDIWLSTNNATSPRIRVPLTVEIESALSISPPTLLLGTIKVGAQTERKVIVRGIRPFRVTDVKGTDDDLSVRDSSPDSKPVHVLTVVVKARKAGEFNRTVRVLTDLKEEGEIDFQARAQIIKP
jgi:hypothetical protein